MSGPFHLYPFEEGMKIQMKKTHPCGGDTWTILRIGADAKLQCDTCGRYLMLQRKKLEQSTKLVLPAPGHL